MAANPQVTDLINVADGEGFEPPAQGCNLTQALADVERVKLEYENKIQEALEHEELRVAILEQRTRVSLSLLTRDPVAVFVGRLASLRILYCLLNVLQHGDTENPRELFSCISGYFFGQAGNRHLGRPSRQVRGTALGAQDSGPERQ
ncbi:hypothetical protein [Kineosporia sp. A_224]|uniref:hypothetical protein n=1 Tax=Kineosporia sp. A_224 TaxID=1962180 RepID=UPI00117AB6E7|nr:hypothetical protein [Kineosporia sp. A_224]